MIEIETSTLSATDTMPHRIKARTKTGGDILTEPYFMKDSLNPEEAHMRTARHLAQKFFEKEEFRIKQVGLTWGGYKFVVTGVDPSTH